MAALRRAAGLIAGGWPSSRLVRMNLIAGLTNVVATIASARRTGYFS